MSKIILFCFGQISPCIFSSLNLIQCLKMPGGFNSLQPTLPFAHLALPSAVHYIKKAKIQTLIVQYCMSSRLIHFWLWCTTLQNQIMHVHLELQRHLNVHVHILSVLVAVSAFAFCQLFFFFFFVQYCVKHRVCFLSSVVECFSFMHRMLIFQVILIF